MFCSSCGKEMQEGASFCSNCGTWNPQPGHPAGGYGGTSTLPQPTPAWKGRNAAIALTLLPLFITPWDFLFFAGNAQYCDFFEGDWFFFGYSSSSCGNNFFTFSDFQARDQLFTVVTFVMILVGALLLRKPSTRRKGGWVILAGVIITIASLALDDYVFFLSSKATFTFLPFGMILTSIGGALALRHNSVRAS